ncbi:MAG: hypothetical protein ACOH1V_11805 [Stenotrophomonas sp.]
MSADPVYRGARATSGSAGPYGAADRMTVRGIRSASARLPCHGLAHPGWTDGAGHAWCVAVRADSSAIQVQIRTAGLRSVIGGTRSLW